MLLGKLILTATMFCCFLQRHYFVHSSPCARKDKVQMTVMSFKPRNSESTVDPLPHYECYLGVGDEDANVTAVRAYRTSNEAQKEPTSITAITDLSQGTSAYTVKLNPSKNNATGVFNCTAVKAGRQNTTIMTIFLRSDSYAYPADGLLTKTVNSGDADVLINMSYTSALRADEDVRWRINGSLTIPDPVRRPPISYVSLDYGLLTNPVTVHDNGLYEAHGFGQRGSSHAMQRLIVRACSPGKWGPPGCTGICDLCYNGGICDDETGRCICPPGFMGTNCLEACGSNKFGYSCEFECDAGGSEDGCRERLFCLLDPFGCRCYTGFTGLNCDIDCPMGTFGSNCLQQCHCEGGYPCDKFTGVCPTGVQCDNSWSGNNCQLTDSCPRGYYGTDCTSKCRCMDDEPCNKTNGLCGNSLCAPGSMLVEGSPACQECPDGYFGESCMEECHCESDACDKVTGECVGCCKNQWIDSPTQTCQEGLSGSSFMMVNPGQSTTFNCSAVILNSAMYSVYLTTSPDQVSGSDDIQGTPSSIASGGDLTSTIEVQAVQSGDEYYCQLRSGTTDVLAWRNTTFSTFTLPVLSAAPTIVAFNQSSVTIEWMAWNKKNDIGDPPVVSYATYYRKSTDTDWTYIATVGTDDSLQYLIPNLDKDTEYTFSVSTVREGLGGEGPRGLPVTVKTLCDAPAAPTDIQTEVTDMQLLNISWKVPQGAKCSTGISGYTIYYHEEGIPGDINQITVDDGARTWFIFRELNPGTSYIFTVSLTTDQESESSVPSSPFVFPEPPDGVPIIPIVIAVIALLLVIIIMAAVIFIKRKRKTSPSPRLDEPSYVNQGMSDVAPSNSSSAYEVTDLPSARPVNGTHYEVNDPVHPPQAQPSGGNHYEVTGQLPATQLSATQPKKNTNQYEVTGPPQTPMDAPPPAQPTAPPPAPPKEKKAIERPPPLGKPAVEEFDVDDSEVIQPEAPDGVYANVPRPMLVSLSQLPGYYRDNKGGNLEQEFNLLKKNKQRPWDVAEKAQNKKKNRFRQLYAYDHSRVVLEPLDGDVHSDYYNASYVLDHQGKNAYIASQAPNSSSINDFWRMIWQQEVATIVMLSNLVENGKERCIQYWPDKERCSKNFGAIVVSWASTTHFADFDVRVLQISMGNDFRNVLQLHYTTWPDMDVPSDTAPLMELVHHSKVVQGSSKGPMLVHCSAGVGRTGTFITLHSLVEVIKKNKMISVFEFVHKARENRVNMVQREMQYVFIYQCLVEYYLTRHTEIPSGLVAQYDIDCKQDTLAEEFNLLSSFEERRDSKMYDGEDHSEKNSFPNTEPTDKGRVYLTSQASTGFSNYINATLYRSLKKTVAYITTQSPLPHTVEDFWRLVYDWDCSVIVMLNQLDHKDKSYVSYWPEKGSSQFGNMSVSFTERTKHAMHIRRQLEVSHISQQKRLSVTQLQLLEWSKGPKFPGLTELQRSGILTHPTPGPILVHCINGIGRSGVFVAVQSTLVQREVSDNVDVFNTVRQMKQRNHNVISTQGDYNLCYRILQDLIQTAGSYENMPPRAFSGHQ